MYLSSQHGHDRNNSAPHMDVTAVYHSLMGTQLKYLSSQLGRDRTANQRISQFLEHSTKVTHSLMGTEMKYLSSQHGHDQSNSPLSMDATGVSHSLTDN
jgi:hypothetical protein